jgi:hypothetical protein
LSKELDNTWKQTVIGNPEIRARILHLLPQIKPENISYLKIDESRRFFSPQVMQQFTFGLYDSNQTFVESNPVLFAMYIPCAIPEQGVELEQLRLRSELQLLPNSSQPTRTNKKRKFCER